MRKIEAMHHYYGFGSGKCANCPHFAEEIWNKKYFKCRVYGESRSEATDWRKSYPACGLIDKPFPVDETRVVERIVRTKEIELPLPGQCTIDEMLRGEQDDT